MQIKRNSFEIKNIDAPASRPAEAGPVELA